MAQKCAENITTLIAEHASELTE